LPRTATRAPSPGAELDRWRSGLHSVLKPRRRRRRRWLLKAGAAVLLLVLATTTAVAGLTYRYATSTFAKIARQPCPGCGADAGDSGPTTILFIGSDTRADIPPSEVIHFCVRRDCSDLAGPEHSDAIMVLRIFPSIHRATLLSIPRDLNVPIPGTGTRDRINAAYEAGPERLVETIRDNFGIRIDHFVDADFVGFRSVVAVLGGINVYFPTPARDVMSGLVVPKSGCVHLDPNQTLAYVRSRHTQFYENGYWRNDPLSDLSRVTRQQDFMRRLIRQIKAIRNPFVAKRVVDGSIRYFKLDDKFSIWDAFGLLRGLRGISPDAVQATTLPVSDLSVGGAAELRLEQPAASQAITSFLRGPSVASSTIAAAVPMARAVGPADPSSPASC